MEKIAFRVLLTILLLEACLCQLKPTHLDMGSVIGLTTDEVIKVLTQEQSDMYQKCMKNFLFEYRQQLQSEGMSREQINKRLFERVVSVHRMWIELRTYMINRLFLKFEMDQLTESFQKEIKQYPADYFLTFEMYDLLFD